MFKSQHLLYGPAELFEKAVSGFCTLTDGIDFPGIVVGGVHLSNPKDRIATTLCEVELYCTTTHQTFSVAGYGSPAFVLATSRRDTEIVVAQQQMSREPTEGLWKYLVMVRVID